jgi:Ca2+-binding EF-hand superfamily protein
MCKLRHALNLPKEAMLQASEIFQKYAKQSSEDFRLTKNGFARVWAEMTHQDAESESNVPPQVVTQAFKHAGKDETLGLNFNQFATWYSSSYFCEDVSVDKDGQNLRRIARKHSMHHSDVERYKQIFKSFDKDGSGTIDAGEFEKLLCKCAKVPTSIGLPPARVKNLWHIADEDGDQEIDFEEFLAFYERYLCTDSTGFEDFYRFGGRRAASA